MDLFFPRVFLLCGKGVRLFNYANALLVSHTKHLGINSILVGVIRIT